MHHFFQDLRGIFLWIGILSSPASINLTFFLVFFRNCFSDPELMNSVIRITRGLDCSEVLASIFPSSVQYLKSQDRCQMDQKFSIIFIKFTKFELLATLILTFYRDMKLLIEYLLHCYEAHLPGTFSCDIPVKFDDVRVLNLSENVEDRFQLVFLSLELLCLREHGLVPDYLGGTGW